MQPIAPNTARPLICYHSPCPDGFGAAYAAWKRYGDDADYVGAGHDNYPVLDVTGRDVFVLDFSFPRAMLDVMAGKAKSLVIIDHHKTARDALADFPGAIFDMSKSGARMAWEYFHPEAPIPMLIAYIEDRDIWTWKLDCTADFLAYLDTQPFDFVVWDQIAQLDNDQGALDKILDAGVAMNRKYNNLVETMAQDAEAVSFAGHVGHKLNCSHLFVSKVGELIYQKSGSFVMLWRIEKGTLKVSLRARVGTVDVAEIAKQYGGGGHAAAAAFQLDILKPEGMNFLMKYILANGD